MKVFQKYYYGDYDAIKGGGAGDTNATKRDLKHFQKATVLKK